MKRRRPALALTGLALALAACGGDDSTTASTTPAATPTATASTTAGGSGSANTADVVEAADAFLETLSSEQRDAVVFEFADEQKRTSWSNLPAALSPRKGIALGDMDEEQQQAALALMEAALSEQGSEELDAVRQADDYLAAQGDSGGGGGPGGGPPGGADDYGAGNYYFALYGTPSADQPWLL